MTPIRVRLMNDYGAEWPLWLDSEGLTDASDWNLSSPLELRLTAWAEFFSTHFDEVHGFPALEMAMRHRAEGIELHHLLAHELGPRHEVVGSFWETNDVRSPFQRMLRRILRAVNGRRG